MRKLSKLVLSPIFALAASSVAIAQTNQTQQKGNEPSSAKADNPVVVVTTYTISQANGCWATLFDEVNHKGPSLTVMGPAKFANLRTNGGDNWEGRIDSVTVGPKATLIMYGGENFTDKDFQFGASTKTADLSHIPQFDTIESLEITCTK